MPSQTSLFITVFLVDFSVKMDLHMLHNLLECFLLPMKLSYEEKDHCPPLPLFNWRSQELNWTLYRQSMCSVNELRSFQEESLH